MCSVGAVLLLYRRIRFTVYSGGEAITVIQTSGSIRVIVQTDQRRSVSVSKLFL